MEKLTEFEKKKRKKEKNNPRYILGDIVLAKEGKHSQTYYQGQIQKAEFYNNMKWMYTIEKTSGWQKEKTKWFLNDDCIVKKLNN